MATKGQIDIYATQATWQDRVKHIFTRMYSRLYTASTLGMLELISLSFGTGGSGTVAVPVFGPRAFAVFRWKKTGEVGITTTRTHSVYVLLQYTSDGNMDGAEGPGAIQNDPTTNTCQLGIAAALGSTAGADTSPWNGTILANGADTKGSPVWSGPTGLYIYPRANASDGTAANKREMVGLIRRSGGGGAPSTRAHMVFDEDNISFLVSTDDSGTYDMVSLVRSSPRAGIASGLPVPPMTLLKQVVGVPFAGGLYPPTGSHYDGSYNGGTLGRTGPLTFDTVCAQLGGGPFLDSSWEPNKQLEPNVYEEMPIEYAVNDLDGRNGRMGNLGTFLRVCTNVATHSTDTGRLRAVFAPTGTSTDWRWVIPWDGATDPGVSVVANGIAF